MTKKEIEPGTLCKFWDYEKENFVIGRFNDYHNSINSDRPALHLYGSGIDGADIFFIHAEPITPEEAYKLIGGKKEFCDPTEKKSRMLKVMVVELTSATAWEIIDCEGFEYDSRIKYNIIQFLVEKGNSDLGDIGDFEIITCNSNDYD